ncbi:MAG: hypothetical protein WDN31_19560 [Hyphomicrobium sp.]
MSVSNRPSRGGEVLGILSRGDPGEPLILRIVLGRQFLDALRKKIAQSHRVGEHERTDWIALRLHRSTLLFQRV